MTGTSFETFLMDVVGGLFLFVQLGIAVVAVIAGLRGPKPEPDLQDVASSGSHALGRGATLPEVQETLGHDNIATTSGYLHARPDSSSGLRLDPGIFRQPEDAAAA
jgi:hypothetical protein